LDVSERFGALGALFTGVALREEYELGGNLQNGPKAFHDSKKAFRGPKALRRRARPESPTAWSHGATEHKEAKA
jgi:hypothetical protein